MLSYLQNALQDANIQAFQELIRDCEGTAAPDGYDYLFGSSPNNTRRFTDMSQHPNVKEPFGNNGEYSDAAGAYQIMYATEQGLIKQLVGYGMSLEQATMFDEATQNLKCVLLFSNSNVCQKIIDGCFFEAINVLNRIWASLPGSPYGEPVKTIAEAITFYTKNGGTINDTDGATA